MNTETVTTAAQIAALPVGSRITDIDGDEMEQAVPNGWVYIFKGARVPRSKVHTAKHVAQDFYPFTVTRKGWGKS